MLSLIIWWSGILVESLLLYRGFRAKLLTKYSAFYSYVLVMFLSDSLLYPLYYMHSKSYEKWSWYTGFVILFAGCGVVLEIFRQVLSPYPGAEKIARIVGMAIVGAIIGFSVFYPIWAPSPTVAQATFLVVQRDFLFVQAIFLLGLLQVISYYGLSMGKNLKGMIFGYGQCVGATLISIALRSYIGGSFQGAWSLIQQVSYFAALVIWLIALWSYCANTVPEVTIGVEADYEVLAARTRDMMGAAGTQLVKVDRP
jgi:hypothetical protein